MSVVAQSPFNAGTKRALFDDENDAPRSGEGGDAAAGAGAGTAGADSPLDGRCKRVRFAAGSSPARAAAATQTNTTTTPQIHPATFAALCALFPGMDDRVVSGVLAECGSDVDAAIRRLTQLRLGAEAGNGGGDGGSSRGGGGSDAGGGGSVGAAAPSAPASEGGGGGEAAAAAADGDNTNQKQKQPQTAEQWTDALVGEMSAARDLPDARGRASKLLAAFEAFVSARREQQRAAAASNAPSTPTGATTHGRVGGSSTPVLQTPGGTLRSADDLVRENAILKRAVQVQHARLQQVMAEGAGGGGGSGSGSGSGGGAAGAAAAALQQQAAENEALRRALGECQQRVRALETTNYALALHLQRAAFGGDGGMGGGGPGGGGNGGDGGDGGGGGGGYFQHPFQPPPPPDVF